MYKEILNITSQSFFVAKLDEKGIQHILNKKKQIDSYLYNRFWYKLLHESLLDYIF